MILHFVMLLVLPTSEKMRFRLATFSVEDLEKRLGPQLQPQTKLNDTLNSMFSIFFESSNPTVSKWNMSLTKTVLCVLFRFGGIYSFPLPAFHHCFIIIIIMRRCVISPPIGYRGQRNGVKIYSYEESLLEGSLGRTT